MKLIPLAMLVICIGMIEVTYPDPAWGFAAGCAGMCLAIFVVMLIEEKDEL